MLYRNYILSVFDLSVVERLHVAFIIPAHDGVQTFGISMLQFEFTTIIEILKTMRNFEPVLKLRMIFDVSNVSIAVNYSPIHFVFRPNTLSHNVS